MNKREFNIAFVNAELKALIAIKRFEKEFENGNQNRQGNVSASGQDNQSGGDVPQQPVYGG